MIAAIPRGAYGTLPRIWLPSRTDLAKGAFLADEPGALAARSLAAFVGSGFPSAHRPCVRSTARSRSDCEEASRSSLGAPLDLPLKIAVARGILPLLALLEPAVPTTSTSPSPSAPSLGATLNPQVELDGCRR